MDTPLSLSLTALEKSWTILFRSQCLIVTPTSLYCSLIGLCYAKFLPVLLQNDLFGIWLTPVLYIMICFISSIKELTSLGHECSKQLEINLINPSQALEVLRNDAKSDENIHTDIRVITSLHNISFNLPGFNIFGQTRSVG